MLHLIDRAFQFSCLLLLCYAFSWPAQALAQTSAKLDAQRAEFLRLEKIVWNTSDQEFAQRIASLADYPLLPYLIERKLLHGLSTRKEQQIEAFLDEYSGTVLERRVRLPWLRYLAKKNRKTLFMKYYRPLGDVDMQCRFLQYQLADKRNKSSVYAQVPKLWNIGKSQSKSCDPVFKAWMNDGQLSHHLVLERIAKAAQGGQHTLIPYLTKLLPDEYRYLGRLWHKVRRSPSQVQHLNRFTGKFAKIEAQIMSYGLSRLIWRDTELALRTYARAEKKLLLSNKLKGEIATDFAISLAIDHHQDAQTWLIQALQFNRDPEVLRWHLAYLLENKDWPSIINLLENTPPDLSQDHQYQYWLARAYAAIGNRAKAQELYAQLAQQRHYYGFLASARIGKQVNLQDRPIDYKLEDLQRIANLAGAKRAHELLLLQRYHEARIEWRAVERALSDQDKLLAAVLSSEWGWHDQAIFAFSRTGYLDDIERRFPIAYADLFKREAHRYNIEPEWAFAIARRESSFMSDAVSPANARGLMQVLPSTAKYLAKKRVSSSQLLKPKVNTKLGTQYLRYLMNKLDDNAILATASYNAGWRRVKRWLPEDADVEADIWVETIPYKETRNYVKAVMAYKQIYRHKLLALQQQSTASTSPESPINKASHASVFDDFILTNIPVSL